jgi:hypothetical protein
VAGLHRIGWPESNGITGRIGPENAAVSIAPNEPSKSAAASSDVAIFMFLTSFLLDAPTNSHGKAYAKYPVD